MGSPKQRVPVNPQNDDESVQKKLQDFFYTHYKSDFVILALCNCFYTRHTDLVLSVTLTMLLDSKESTSRKQKVLMELLGSVPLYYVLPRVMFTRKCYDEENK